MGLLVCTSRLHTMEAATKALIMAKGATYDLTNKVGEYYFISSRGEFIHTVSDVKNI